MNMQPSLTAGATLILPDEPLDAVMYSCTSGSVVIGEAEIEKAMQVAKPGVAVVTPTAAAVRALKALGAKRISVLTPYTVETADRWPSTSRTLASRSTASPAFG
jgi:maleate isomerase